MTKNKEGAIDFVANLTFIITHVALQGCPVIIYEYNLILIVVVTHDIKYTTFRSQ